VGTGQAVGTKYKFGRVARRDRGPMAGGAGSPVCCGFECAGEGVSNQ
jgi:hypothetical protein